MLDVHGLEVWYGAAPALWGVSLTLRAGELLAVVGPNGAGKTTLINALCGIERARAGRIVVDGTDVTRWPSHRFCAAGIAVVPEGRRLFTAMTVRENLELGSHLPRARAERADSLAAALELFPALGEKLASPAGELSGGQQQMVAIARALMARPRLLLLDEPSLGLAPIIVQDLFRRLGALNAEQGVTMLVVEQNANLAFDIAHRAYVLEAGQIALSGTADELRNDEAVRRAYLGY